MTISSPPATCKQLASESRPARASGYQFLARQILPLQLTEPLYLRVHRCRTKNVSFRHEAKCDPLLISASLRTGTRVWIDFAAAAVPSSEEQSANHHQPNANACEEDRQTVAALRVAVKGRALVSLNMITNLICLSVADSFDVGGGAVTKLEMPRTGWRYKCPRPTLIFCTRIDRSETYDPYLS